MAFSTGLNVSLFLSNKFVENRLAESAAKIAFYNFEWRFTTFLFINTAILCGEELFGLYYNKSVIVGQNRSYTPYAETTKQQVIFGADTNNIQYMLEWMHQKHFDNTGKHIIICLSEKKKDCNESEAVRIFWNYTVTNVVFLRRAHNERGIVGFTYFQFEDSLCNVGSPVRLNNLDACIDDPSKENCKMFPPKLRNLNGCPLTVSTFEQPPYMYLKNKSRVSGADGDLLWILCEGLNASLKIMTPRKSDGWGLRTSDGTWVGSLGDLYYGFANFSMTYPAITMNRYTYFDMSISYNFVYIGWIIRYSQYEPSSLKLLHPFSKSTHIAVIMTFTFVVVSGILIKSKFWNKLRKIMKMGRPRSSVVFYSWMLCMGMPKRRLPNKPALLALVYIWVWYTFLIRTVYQASLISSLKNNKYLPNYETVEAAINEGFKFGGSAPLREYFIDYPAIHKDWISLNSSEIESNALRISDGLQFVQAINLETAKLLLRKSQDHKIYTIPEKILASPTVVYFKKFSPLVEPFNRVLRCLIEAGFTDKLYKNYCHYIIPKDPEKHKPLTLEHYMGCYLILVTGWIISFVFFLGEIVSVMAKSQYIFHKHNS